MTALATGLAGLALAAVLYLPAGAGAPAADPSASSTAAVQATAQASRAGAGGHYAHRLALRIARLGSRPAASASERRTQRLVAPILRSGGFDTVVQRFGVPGRGTSRNVIGVRDTRRDCLRIVMAHADSMPAAPGANDNASGTAAVAALARRLRGRRLACDTWLVSVGAEERLFTGAGDHLGALALSRRVRARGRARDLDWALSLDEVGRGRDFWLRSPASSPRRGVEGAILRAARAAGARARWVRDTGTGNSDHREFELAGMAAAKLGVGAGGDRCRHLACDTPGRLERAALGRAVATAERALTVR